MLLTGAYYAAFGLRFDGELPPDYWHRFVFSAPLVVLTKLLLLASFRPLSLFLEAHGDPGIDGAGEGAVAGHVVRNGRLRHCRRVRCLSAFDHPVRLVHQPAHTGSVQSRPSPTTGHVGSHPESPATAPCHAPETYCFMAPAIWAHRWPSRSRRGILEPRRFSASSTTTRLSSA